MNKVIMSIFVLLTSITAEADRFSSDGFGPDEPNKPLIIEGPMISVAMPNDTILRICRDIRHPESNQPIYDWLLSQLYQLREESPKYPVGTKFRPLFRELPLVLPVDKSNCMAKANQYIEVIRNDIAENRRNLNNPDYVPHDVPGYIRRMRIYGFPWPSQLVCPPSGCRRAEDISGK